VYDAVLSVHAACLGAVRPGATLRHLHHLSVRLLVDAIAQVGWGGTSAAPAVMGAPLIHTLLPWELLLQAEAALSIAVDHSLPGVWPHSYQPACWHAKINFCTTGSAARPAA
jgi:hypothetical protein